ncbi:MAG: GNAT family N-acetyltransferase [Candidatus Hermodarchaeota archaeon]
MEINKVNLDDLDTIMKMEKEAFKSDAFSKETMKKLILQSPLFLKLIKKQDKQKILGFIIIIQDYLNRLNIINFLINKKNQNKGYGSYLLTKTLEIVRKMDGIKKIVLNVKTKNRTAIKLYEEFNFRIVREIENYYRNQENAYLMELDL